MFDVTFWDRAAIELADSEKASLLEPNYRGSIDVRSGGLVLVGAWRMSWIGTYLPLLMGALGGLIRPLFRRHRSEEVRIQHVHRVIEFKKSKGVVVFHLFQTREDGLIEVHVFAADKTTSPEIMKALRSEMPAGVFQERVA